MYRVYIYIYIYIYIHTQLISDIFKTIRNKNKHIYISVFIIKNNWKN